MARLSRAQLAAIFAKAGKSEKRRARGYRSRYVFGKRGATRSAKLAKTMARVAVAEQRRTRRPVAEGWFEREGKAGGYGMTPKSKPSRAEVQKAEALYSRWRRMAKSSGKTYRSKKRRRPKYVNPPKKGVRRKQFP